MNHKAKEHSRHDFVTSRRVSTNAVEGYFGNFKRQIDGTHHHVSASHLHRYSSEEDEPVSLHPMKFTDAVLALLGPDKPDRVSLSERNASVTKTNGD